MTIKLGVVMDPIASINPKKDSTLAMLLEAQRRDWQICYMEQQDLFLRDGKAFARWQSLQVRDTQQDWFTLDQEDTRPLAELDVILMRKDPPFDIDYIYSTYILEQAEQAGTLVVNRPRSLRDANEKLATAWFPQCTAPSLVTSNARRIREFLEEFGDIIVKPLSAMGGASVFRIRRQDPNINVILEVMTGHGRQLIMAQRYLAEISDGDKRILLVDGEPIPYSLARLAAPGETRANLAAGGSSEGRPLTERERWICAEVGPTLRDRGLLFVGLDVIGDYLTEINVTSPTCIRELDTQFNINVSARLLDCIEARLQ
jgi:glutathione synthase